MESEKSKEELLKEKKESNAKVLLMRMVVLKCRQLKDADKKTPVKNG